jgi:hypothetical protein
MSICCNVISLAHALSKTASLQPSKKPQRKCIEGCSLYLPPQPSRSPSRVGPFGETPASSPKAKPDDARDRSSGWPTQQQHFQRVGEGSLLLQRTPQDVICQNNDRTIAVSVIKAAVGLFVNKKRSSSRAERRSRNFQDIGTDAIVEPTKHIIIGGDHGVIRDASRRR